LAFETVESGVDVGDFFFSCSFSLEFRHEVFDRLAHAWDDGVFDVFQFGLKGCYLGVYAFWGGQLGGGAGAGAEEARWAD
jgi:hypothetical protein